MVVTLAIMAVDTTAKKPKRSWQRINSMEELVNKQNEVLIQAADLGKAGDYLGAAELLKDFTKRIEGLASSGALGSNLLNTMGDYYRIGKDLDAAEEAHEEAIEALKNYQPKEGEPEEIKETRRLVNAAELHRTRESLAKVKVAMADPEGVVEQYKMLLREQEIPEYRSMAAKELGIHHMRMEELELGKVYLEFAVEVHPTIPKGYANLALVLHKLGDLDDAEEAFLEAIKLEPDNASAYSNLGTLYAQSGETGDAKRYFELALSKDPNHEDAKAKLKQLEEVISSEKAAGGVGMPKFRSPMKKVGGDRKERRKFEL